MATRALPSLHRKNPWSFGMVISIVIVLIIFFLNIEIVCSITGEEEWYPPPICNWTANYTKDSEFVSNVNATLSNLHVNNIEDTSQSRFSISDYGQSPNQIYALIQCRGDATVSQCYSCSKQAKIALEQDCANYVGSRVWSKFCFLRYNGNYNFTGQLDTNRENETNQHFFYNIDTTASPDVFLQAARNLLFRLAFVITSGSSRNRYASNSTIDTSYRRVYGLAQCWGDITLDDCQTCLTTTIDKLFQQYNGAGYGARALTGNCIVQYDMNPFFNDLQELTGPQKLSSSKIPIILGVLGCLVIALLMVGLFAARTRLKSAIFGRDTESGRHMNEDSQIEEEDQQTIPNLMSNDFTIFEMKTLVAATENFHGKNTLGKGGFGAVYKGTTPDGIEIAVKKLSLKSMQGKREFLNEVRLVAKIQHRNLVKLLGCCAEGSERLLVYEYLPNNSLDKILFDPNERRHLDWHERYNIIMGVTRGLLYLHEDSHLRIIHRDIKASNILLDDKWNPKIADFGLARLFVEDETHVRTRVAGTRGYMAPEYAMHGELSVKADVYSFGIVVLELLSGRKSIDFNLSPEMHILLEWAWRLFKRGNIVDMIDPEIIGTCSDLEQPLRCIHVGFLCTQAEPSLRPSMSAINLMLSTNLMILPDPTKPAFVDSTTTGRSMSTGDSSGPK